MPRVWKHKTIPITVFLLLLALPYAASGQEVKSLVASAKGEGTITLGKEEFKLHSIVVKLFEDGKTEINLVTDITVFLAGAWTRGDDDKSINLTTTASNLEGGGKLFLGEDRKSIIGLKLEIFNKISKKNIKVEFVAK